MHVVDVIGDEREAVERRRKKHPTQRQLQFARTFQAPAAVQSLERSRPRRARCRRTRRSQRGLDASGEDGARTETGRGRVAGARLRPDLQVFGRPLDPVSTDNRAPLEPKPSAASSSLSRTRALSPRPGRHPARATLVAAAADRPVLPIVGQQQLHLVRRVIERNDRLDDGSITSSRGTTCSAYVPLPSRPRRRRARSSRSKPLWMNSATRRRRHISQLTTSQDAGE